MKNLFMNKLNIYYANKDFQKQTNKNFKIIKFIIVMIQNSNNDKIQLYWGMPSVRDYTLLKIWCFA